MKAIQAPPALLESRSDAGLKLFRNGRVMSHELVDAWCPYELQQHLARGALPRAWNLQSVPQARRPSSRDCPCADRSGRPQRGNGQLFTAPTTCHCLATCCMPCTASHRRGSASRAWLAVQSSLIFTAKLSSDAMKPLGAGVSGGDAWAGTAARRRRWAHCAPDRRDLTLLAVCRLAHRRLDPWPRVSCSRSTPPRPADRCHRPGTAPEPRPLNAGARSPACGPGSR